MKRAFIKPDTKTDEQKASSIQPLKINFVRMKKTKIFLYSFIMFFFIPICNTYIVSGCKKDINDSIEERNSIQEGWEPYIVDGNKQVGYYCAVKAETDGKIHVAYLDRTNENLKYAFGIDGKFTPVTAEQGANLGQWPSIFLDNARKLHISFYDRIGLGIKYTKLNNGEWFTETVDSENVGPQSSVVVDEAVRIAYFDRGNEDLKYAVRKNNNWSISILDSAGATGYYPSMVILPSGKKSIAYYNKTEEKIKIIDPDAMTNQFVASVKPGSENISFCINSEGKRFITYHDPELGSLMVASESEDGFKVSKIKDGGAGKWSSIEADTAGKLHISFSVPQNKGCLGYAVYDGNSWAIEIVDTGPEAGQFSDICILPDGRPLIVYFDRVYARLLCVIRKH